MGVLPTSFGALLEYGGRAGQLAGMTLRQRIMPKTVPLPDATPSGPLVVALAFDGMPLFELAIAGEIFGLDRPEFGADWYRFAIASENARSVKTNVGPLVTVDSDLGGLALAHTIVVPGWHTRHEPVSAALADPLLAAARRGARIVSICSGAFLLAELGLLDGRRATTHWRYAELLASRYPQVAVEPDILFADAGMVLTSAGSAAGIDLLLHIVRCDYGVARANAVAKRLVLPAQREGGQRQFDDRVRLPQSPDRLSVLMRRIMAEPAQDWPIERLAREAGMSTRSLARAFAAQVGCGPGAYVLSARIARARQLLETTRLSIERVAEASGFASATSLQQNFRKALGRTPSGYRRDFAPV